MWATLEGFRTAVRAGLPEWPWACEVEVKRPGRPEEVAQAALFLLSDEARFITGQTLFGDGGPSLGGSLGFS